MELPHSSNASARASTLDLDPSRALACWWWLLHLLLGATALALALPAVPTLALLAGVATHGLGRRPRMPERLVLEPDGTWSIPELGRFGLSPCRGTAWSTWYVQLALEGGPGPLVRVLILRDQLNADAWRRLQLAVRERRHGGA